MNVLRIKVNFSKVPGLLIYCIIKLVSYCWVIEIVLKQTYGNC